MARCFNQLSEVTRVERFQHRLRMSGEPIYYDVIGAAQLGLWAVRKLRVSRGPTSCESSRLGAAEQSGGHP